LFKREQGRTKASITLTLHDGRALRREQVRGIQRLVAAAVPGIESRDVTIVSDQGVALTQDGDAPDGGASASLRMELKREIEQYLAHKANTLLDKAFGPGQALASVDVTLDMNQLRVTTEDVTTPPGVDGEGPVGVVLRERETTREGNRGGAGLVSDSQGPASSQREIDYQLGRRVEQVVSSPGTVVRLQALAILRAPLSPAQVEQVRQLLSSAVGATRERGDVVVVQPLEGLAATVGHSAVPAAMSLPTAVPAAQPQWPASAAAVAEADAADADRWAVVQALVALAALVVVLVALLAVWRRRGAAAPSLDAAQREASVAQVRAWLAQSDGGLPPGGPR
jgi:flagellar M-ring protein FliF